jgi:hypothetical protein
LSLQTHCPRSLFSFGPFRSDPHWHGTDPQPETKNKKVAAQRRVEGTIRTRKTLPPEPPIEKMVRDRTHTPHTSNHHNQSDTPSLCSLVCAGPVVGTTKTPRLSAIPQGMSSTKSWHQTKMHLIMRRTATSICAEVPCMGFVPFLMLLRCGRRRELVEDVEAVDYGVPCVFIYIYIYTQFCVCIQRYTHRIASRRHSCNHAH